MSVCPTTGLHSLYCALFESSFEISLLLFLAKHRIFLTVLLISDKSKRGICTSNTKSHPCLDSLSQAEMLWSPRGHLKHHTWI